VFSCGPVVAGRDRGYRRLGRDKEHYCEDTNKSHVRLIYATKHLLTYLLMLRSSTLGNK